MAINENANVNIELNSKSAQHRLAELENQLSTLNKKKAEFERTGNTAGLVKVEQDIKKVNRQMNTARTNAQKCEAALQKLNSASPKDLRMVLKQLQNDLNHIERGSAAWNRHVETIKRVKAEIKTVDAELREHEGLLSRMNRKVNEWGMSIASAAAAFTGLVFTARQAVQAYADMEAEMANVRKFTGMTAEDVTTLNDEFKKIDTRTSREDLNKLAQEAGRLGLQSQEDVLGFVTAANQINVALDDLGEGATLTLSKLTDIFGDKQRLGVEQSLLAVGSVINELSQNCTASAPYLANFAQRLAGVGKQAKMTIPEIMGFAAVLDSQGQAVEMSATALSQLIMKLFKDPAKIAKATGMDLQAFNKVLKEDTNEALIMLLEQLNQLGNIDVLAPIFAEMGTDGARASGVLAALAGNIDMVKKQQLAANQAFKEGTSVTKEYNVQNNTVQAQLDKAKKKFHEMAVELGQKLAPAMKYAITGTSAMMRVLSGLISFIAKNKGTIVALTLAVIAYTTAAKYQAIATNLVAGATKAANVYFKAFEVTMKLLQAVFYGVTLQSTKAKAAMQAFSAATKANPVGLLVGALTLLIAKITEVISKTQSAAAEAARVKKEHEEWKKSLVDLNQASADYAAKEKTRLDALYRAATDETRAHKERIAAVNQMQSLYPSVFSNFNTETIMAGKAKNAYDKLSLSIINNARARAAADKIYENEKKILELQMQLEQESEVFTKARAKSDEARQRSDQAREKAVASASTISGAFIAAEGGNTAMQQMHEAEHSAQNYEKATREAAKNVMKTNGEINDLIAANKKLAAIPGVKELAQGGGESATTPTISYTNPGGGGGGKSSGGKNGGGEDDALKKMKAEIEALTAKKNDDLSKLNDQYRKGDLASYNDYVDKQYNRTTQFYSDVLAVYKKYGQNQSKEAADMRSKQADDEAKHDQALLERKKKALEQQRDADKIAAQMRYYEPSSDIFHNQQALDNELAQIDIEYLEKIRDLTVENTKERADAELALEKAKQAEELRQRKVMEQNLAAWLYIYSQQGAKARMDAELAVVDELHKQEVIKEEEVEEAKAAIRKKYRDEVNSKTGTKAPNQDFTDAKDDYDKQLQALEDANKQGLLDGQEDYESRRYQIIQNYHNKIAELIGNEGNAWATMVTNLVETWQAGFEDLGATIPDKLKTIADMAAAAFAVMNEGIRSYSEYANASRDLELAKVEKNYDAQIEAAGNNEAKRKQLEEKKQRDIAKIKTKYDKRAMAMEMAQAVASTAMAAINAYSSAAQVPYIGYILAPIAAAAALAAGAMQIATIKKQHQAQQMGYYEGGFTGRDPNNRREAGVVHANEFVANHRAVANPELLPVLRLIDQAQRNNTVGSLTSEDVSRALGQGAFLGDMTAAQQRTASREDRSMQLVAASMEQQTAAINELNGCLADGIEAFMVMDGERGFDRSWERYQRMKNNPQR